MSLRDSEQACNLHFLAISLSTSPFKLLEKLVAVAPLLSEKFVAGMNLPFETFAWCMAMHYRSCTVSLTHGG